VGVEVVEEKDLSSEEDDNLLLEENMDKFLKNEGEESERSKNEESNNVGTGKSPIKILAPTQQEKK
jgi:hypothetical protein